MKHNFEITIYRVPATNLLGIWITQERDGVIYLAEPLQLTFKETKTGYEPPPTLEFPYPDSEQFMKAMAEAIDRNGIRTDSDAKIQGIMEATKYHLEDLRSLLNLKGDQSEHKPNNEDGAHDQQRGAFP